MKHFWDMKEYQIGGLRVRMLEDNQRVKRGEILVGSHYDFDFGFLFAVGADNDPYPFKEEEEGETWEFVL